MALLSGYTLSLFKRARKIVQIMYIWKPNHFANTPMKKYVTTFSVISNQLPSHRNHSFEPRWNWKIEINELRDEHSYMQLWVKNTQRRSF
jgi:hypothetical protein